MSPDTLSKIIEAETTISVRAMSAHSRVVGARHYFNELPDLARERLVDARANMQRTVDALDDAIAAMDDAPADEAPAASNVVHLIAAE